MTCQELIDFLTDYLDGQLPLRQRVAFELHLTLCSECRDYLHNFKTAIEATKQACCESQAPKIEPIPESLVSAILRSRNQGQS